MNGRNAVDRRYAMEDEYGRGNDRLVDHSQPIPGYYPNAVMFPQPTMPPAYNHTLLDRMTGGAMMGGAAGAFLGPGGALAGMPIGAAAGGILDYYTNGPNTPQRKGYNNEYGPNNQMPNALTRRF